MTNEELQAAITVANSMAMDAGKDSPRFAMLLDHLHALLREQQRRSILAPVAAPAVAPIGPVFVQPWPMQPTWAPPFIVTC